MTAAVHVIANAGDKVSLCGIKDPLPVVWAPYIAEHVTGWGMVVCPECATRMESE